MTKDVFISHSNRDKALAEKLCTALEDVGLSCWIAPRNIPPGAEFDVAILDGIDQCTMFVLILSSDANSSPYVKNEVNRAFSQGKRILTFRVEDIVPGKSLEFYLARHQWTDGFPPPVEDRIARLAIAILDSLGKSVKRLDTSANLVVATGTAEVASPNSFPTNPAGGEARLTPPTSPAATFEREVGESLRTGRLELRLEWGNSEYVNLLATALSQELERRNFSAADRIASQVALKELINNGRHATGETLSVRLELSPSRVTLSVEDLGEGFDWKTAIDRLVTELDAGGREHGILRAIRYGTGLRQSRNPHRIYWWRDRHPETIASKFDGLKGVVPSVFDYESAFVRIADEVHRSLGSTHSVAHTDIAFEPLRRASGWIIGIEVRGSHPTVSGALPSVKFVRTVIDYLTRRSPRKRLAVFANTELEDHRELASLCSSDRGGMVAFYEIWEECAASIEQWLALGRPT